MASPAGIFSFTKKIKNPKPPTKQNQINKQKSIFFFILLTLFQGETNKHPFFTSPYISTIMELKRTPKQ